MMRKGDDALYQAPKKFSKNTFWEETGWKPAPTANRDVCMILLTFNRTKEDNYEKTSDSFVCKFTINR